MAINKKLIHFKNFSDFNSKKLSANENNTQYTLGIDGAVTDGSPDILYQSICWIKDTKQQWTHGQLYDGSKSDTLLNETDPIFSASPAATITEEDITVWNGAADLVAGHDTDIAQLFNDIEGKQDTISDLTAIREGASKGATALQSYTEQYKGTVTGVKINGSTKSPSNGIVDLGTVITTHQILKTINGQSIVGSGNIEISGGGSSSVGNGAYPEVDGTIFEGLNQGEYICYDAEPNTFYVFPECTELTFSPTIDAPRDGLAHEYLFQFTSGSTPTTLNLPDGIRWANDTPPTIAEKMIYQVSILKGLATVLEFSNKPKTKQCTLNRGYDTIALVFEDGMTWNTWVNSSYNNYNLYVSGGNVFITSMFIVSGVTPNDVMEEKDYTYLIYD